MTPDELTMCEGCHQLTKTVVGKCPNCWYQKQPSMVKTKRRHRPSAWNLDEFDLLDFGWFLVSWSTGLAVLVVGLLIDAPVLIFVGAVLLAIRLFGASILEIILGNWW